MPTKMIGQKSAIWWIPESVYASGPPATLSLATLSAAITANTMVNLTPAIAQGYTLNPTDSDTEDAKSVADSGNAQSRGAYNFEANIPFFREDDPTTNTTSIFLKAYTLFKSGHVYGYLAQRIGYPYNTALAVGQKLSVYHVCSDYPRDERAGDAGGPILFRVPFGQQGWMVKHQAIVT